MVDINIIFAFWAIKGIVQTKATGMQIDRESLPLTSNNKHIEKHFLMSSFT